MDKNSRIKKLFLDLPKLTNEQLSLVEALIEEFQKPTIFWENPESDLISKCVLQNFGDVLRLHHCFSNEAFTKDKFEYAFEKTLNLCGFESTLAMRGNPGHDITIKGQKISLKTQADKNIKLQHLHISKFMELGKGSWQNEEDLKGLREQFFNHMKTYDRIFSLRRLSLSHDSIIHYELVEIPKSLLLEVESARLEMRHESTQTDAKPSYCKVLDKKGFIKFQLYFDGGGERKLQIQKLDKKYCIVHAEWKFNIPSAEKELPMV